MEWNCNILDTQVYLDKALDEQTSYKLWHLLYSFEGDNSATGDSKLKEIEKNGQKILSGSCRNFDGCPIEDLKALILETGAFESCVNLQSVDFTNVADNFTFGGGSIFYNCTSLGGKLTIPSSIVTIYGDTFSHGLFMYNPSTKDNLSLRYLFNSNTFL